jgi:O-antigen/teichoic acid export membrane protein
VSERGAGAETRGYGRSAAGLTAALGLVGVLTYVFFALASRILDADSYGEIVVLWSIVFLLSSTLFRPIEQLLARTLAEREQQGINAGDALRAAGLIQGGICVAGLLGLLAARVPIQDNLFSEDPGLYWALLAAFAGFALAYYARGFLAGRRQFRLYAALLMVEVLLRLAFVLAVAIGVAEGAGMVAVGIATAPLAALVVLPLSARAKSIGRPGREAAPGEGSELTLGSGGAFAGAVLVMMLSEQVLVGSGVLFVRAVDGAAAAGFIFNVLIVARAPLVLFQAIAASLLPHLARLRARGDAGSREAFRSSLENTILLIAVFALLVTVGVVAIGPQVMQLAFGDAFSYGRLDLAIVAVGMGFYLVAASLNQAALAQGQAHRAAARWALCAGAFAAFNLLAPFDQVRTVEVGFLATAAVLAGLLYLVYRSPQPRSDDEVEPGSPHEVQAQLASTDEIA